MPFITSRFNPRPFRKEHLRGLNYIYVALVVVVLLQTFVEGGCSGEKKDKSGDIIYKKSDLTTRIVISRRHQRPADKYYGVIDNKLSQMTATIPGPEPDIVQVVSADPDSDFVLTPDIQKASIHLECSAPYPIQWMFEGPGEPNFEIAADTSRTFGKLDDEDSYTFTATLNLMSVEEKNTGKYTCRSLAEDQVQVYYYVYVPGPKFFLSQTVRTTVEGKLDEDFLRIPCPISYPTDQISAELFRVGEMNHPEKIESATFDSKTGFMVEMGLVEDDPWGTYICVCGNSSMTSSLIVDVLPPKKSMLRHTVKGHYVHQREKIQQRFICEGKSNVTFQIAPYFPLGKRKSRISYFYDSDRDFPFIATLQTDPKEFANYSLIACLLNDNHNVSRSLEDNSLLDDIHGRKRRPVSHTWEYSVYGNDKNLTFSYSQKLNSFLCCTSDSYVSPEITHFRPCSSLQECRLRNYRPRIKLLERREKSFVSKEDLAMFDHYNSPSNKLPSKMLPIGCSGVRRFGTDHDGFFRCSIPAKPAISLGTTNTEEELLVQDFFYSSLKGKPVLSFEELKSTEEIIVIEFGGKENKKRIRGGAFRVHQEVEVTCKTNSFFFSEGHHWSFRWKNGTVQSVPSKLLKEEVVTVGGHIKKIEFIKFPHTDVSHLICYAPCWYSTDWKNASVAVKVNN